MGFPLLNKNGVYFVRVSSPISFPCVGHYRHACIVFHCLWCAESSSIVCDHTASFCLVIYCTSALIFENRFFFPNRAPCHSPPCPLVLFTSLFISPLYLPLLSLPQLLQFFITYIKYFPFQSRQLVALIQESPLLVLECRPPYSLILQLLRHRLPP